MMDEIAEHPLDESHVSTVAGRLKGHLYRVTLECDRAEDRHIRALREKFLKGDAT